MYCLALKTYSEKATNLWGELPFDLMLTKAQSIQVYSVAPMYKCTLVLWKFDTFIITKCLQIFEISRSPLSCYWLKEVLKVQILSYRCTVTFVFFLENLKFNPNWKSPTVFVVSPLLLPYVDNALAISLVGQSEF